MNILPRWVGTCDPAPQTNACSVGEAGTAVHGVCVRTCVSDFLCVFIRVPSQSASCLKLGWQWRSAGV